jgi:hypothetical protein
VKVKAGARKSRAARQGEVGRYAKRYAEGTNVVVLDPDVAAVFKTAESVNRVLREHLKKSSERDA